MQQVYILSSVRTPIGSFCGKLSSISATQLGGIAIREAVRRANIDPNLVTEVFMGNVLGANVGQAPARQAAIFAGLNPGTICTTVNKVCASGMKSLILGAQSIMLGQNEIVVAGGMESMSNVPFYIDKMRKGNKIGNTTLVDGLIKDGLWDVYNNYHMGNAAELLAKTNGITREMQDEFAKKSYSRSNDAWANGKFNHEIVPVDVSQNGKEPILITEDEEYKNVDFEKMGKLKPVFQQDGTVTAANASTLNDGASALVLIGENKLKELGLKPLARIAGYGEAAQSPERFTTSPSLAIPKAIKNAQLKEQDIDFYEINEAFSVVALANIQILGLDPEKVNKYGGAVSLGHPLGASGSRIVNTMISVLHQENATIGICGICNGGGGASAIVIEKT